ncbi:MAG TPA: exodeoxyribonuclease V subunit gamma, partial [Aggregatilineales bacterium]|nr:exodeoxyribonuclease V subunit gamma [Aggregatilineales bacterium]
LLNGAKPDDILIAVRDWNNYRPHLSAYAEKYRLPIVLHYDEPLTETPFVMTLTHLLDLAHANFPRRGVLDALRSPYINGAGLSAGDIDLLEAISEKQ